MGSEMCIRDRADSLLAKHDENYVPRELQEMTEHQARQVVAETETGGGR